MMNDLHPKYGPCDVFGPDDSCSQCTGVVAEDVKSKCICEGNWRNIFWEYYPYFGHTYIKLQDHSIWTLLGLADCGEDYYFIMVKSGETKYEFLSCVGGLDKDSWGYERVVT